MTLGLLCRQPLQAGLFAGDDDVDPVIGTQAMIDRPQQRIGIRWQIDANDISLLVDDMIDEAGVLMAQAIMILTPDMTGEQIIERSDRAPPVEPARHLEPLGMLIEHRIDDVDEGLVAVEQAMPSGQQIAFQPALAEIRGVNLE